MSNTEVRQYKVEISRAANFNTLVWEGVTARPNTAAPLTLDVGTALTPNGIYFVRVAPIIEPTAPGFDSVMGAYSGHVKFTVNASP